MTLTNPNNSNDMQYQSIYEIIGEYLSNNLHLFDKNLRNEYEAGIQWFYNEKILFKLT